MFLENNNDNDNDNDNDKDNDSNNKETPRPLAAAGPRRAARAAPTGVRAAATRVLTTRSCPSLAQLAGQSEVRDGVPGGFWG